MYKYLFIMRFTLILNLNNLKGMWAGLPFPLGNN